MVGVSTLISRTRAAEQFLVALGAGMNEKFATVFTFLTLFGEQFLVALE